MTPPPDWRRGPFPVIAAHVLLLVAFGLDFYLDVRERDVFSWMDPYQYYDFAVGVLAGREHFTRFEVPSIFPFFVMPALVSSPSIPAALGTNVAFTVLLVGVVHGLCRELEVRTPSVLVAALVPSSPLLIGLARTLYVEYALTAVVGLAFLLWLRFIRTAGPRVGVGFGLVFGLGFMLKMTFPLFLFLPVCAALLLGLRERRSRDVYAIVTVTLFPLVFALLVQAAFFPRSFSYYLSLGNTAVPIMNLIGPPAWVSAESFFYYFGEIGQTLLFLLTPLLILAALLAARTLRLPQWSGIVAPRTTLWLWLLGPLLLLILQPVKEPRHVAPCVVPAMLLVVLAIEAVPAAAMRRALAVAVAGLAITQFGAVTTGRIDAPYFMDRPLHWAEIRDTMMRSSGFTRYARKSDAARLLRWKYDQNVVTIGFEANEALALAWQSFPGVVIDLETLADSSKLTALEPVDRFEDLYILAAFNSYNRRCGWQRYSATLPSEAVVANADFVIVDEARAPGALDRLTDHELVGSIERDGGPIRILRARRASTTPYRALYARAFLERSARASEMERKVALNEMLTAVVLGGDRDAARAILAEHPELADAEGVIRNIYWIGGYEVIARLARERMPRGSGR